jgi:hypothetical protein
VKEFLPEGIAKRLTISHFTISRFNDVCSASGDPLLRVLAYELSDALETSERLLGLWIILEEFAE